MTKATGRMTVFGLTIGAFLFAGAAHGQQTSPFTFDNGKPEPPKVEETIFDILSVGPTSPGGVSADGLDARQILDLGVNSAGEEALYWRKRMIVQALADPENNATWALGALVAQLYSTDGQSKENMHRLELLWQLMAVAGDSRAMCNLGRKYKDGIGGPKDSRLARQWYERAQAAGCAEAAQALAELGQ